MIISRLILSSLLLLSSLPAFTSDQKQIINELFENTGLNSVLENVPQQIMLQAKESLINNHADPISAQEELLVFKYLSIDYLREHFLGSLSTRLNDQILDTLQRQNNLPLMQKIHSIEQNISSSNDKQLQEQMAGYFELLNQIPPSQKRLDLIMALEEASMATDSIIFLMEKVLRGVSQVMTTDKSTVSDQQIEQELSLASMMMQTAAKTQIIMMMHFTYRDVSDEELQSFIDITNSTEKQAFLVQSVEVLGDVFLDALKKGFNELQAMKSNPNLQAI